MPVLKQPYEWLLKKAAGPYADHTLAAVAFAESSFFPIPPDIMLVPMVLARPERAWRSAAICTGASVAGGLLGYAIGYWLLASIGHWIIALYHLEGGLAHFQEEFARYGVAIILIKGLTPIPFKLVTIACGIAHFSLSSFILASLATRGGRFFLVAGLVKRFGAPVQVFIERYLTWVLLAILAAIVAGFWMFLRTTS